MCSIVVPCFMGISIITRQHKSDVSRIYFVQNFHLKNQLPSRQLLPLIHVLRDRSSYVTKNIFLQLKKATPSSQRTHHSDPRRRIAPFSCWFGFRWGHFYFLIPPTTLALVSVPSPFLRNLRAYINSCGWLVCMHSFIPIFIRGWVI